MNRLLVGFLFLLGCNFDAALNRCISAGRCEVAGAGGNAGAGSGGAAAASGDSGVVDAGFFRYRDAGPCPGLVTANGFCWVSPVSQGSDLNGVWASDGGFWVSTSGGQVLFVPEMATEPGDVVRADVPHSADGIRPISYTDFITVDSGIWLLSDTEVVLQFINGGWSSRRLACPLTADESWVGVIDGDGFVSSNKSVCRLDGGRPLLFQSFDRQATFRALRDYGAQGCYISVRLSNNQRFSRCDGSTVGDGGWLAYVPWSSGRSVFVGRYVNRNDTDFHELLVVDVADGGTMSITAGTRLVSGASSHGLTVVVGGDGRPFVLDGGQLLELSQFSQGLSAVGISAQSVLAAGSDGTLQRIARSDLNAMPFDLSPSLTLPFGSLYAVDGGFVIGSHNELLSAPTGQPVSRLTTWASGGADEVGFARFACLGDASCIALYSKPLRISFSHMPQMALPLRIDAGGVITDLTVDESGYWFTTSGGSLFRVEPDGGVRKEDTFGSAMTTVAAGGGRLIAAGPSNVLERVGNVWSNGSGSGTASWVTDQGLAVFGGDSVIYRKSVDAGQRRYLIPGDAYIESLWANEVEIWAVMSKQVDVTNDNKRAIVVVHIVDDVVETLVDPVGYATRFGDRPEPSLKSRALLTVRGLGDAVYFAGPGGALLRYPLLAR